MSSLDIQEIALIKIDVEHGEFAVLQGMTKVLTDFRPVLVCEVLPRPRDKQRLSQIMDYLTSLGYTVARILKKDDFWQGIEVIREFPLADWSEKESEQYDYLLMPNETWNAVREKNCTELAGGRAWQITGKGNGLHGY
jgi:hypothetical protein